MIKYIKLNSLRNSVGSLFDVSTRHFTNRNYSSDVGVVIEIDKDGVETAWADVKGLMGGSFAELVDDDSLRERVSIWYGLQDIKPLKYDSRVSLKYSEMPFQRCPYVFL